MSRQVSFQRLLLVTLVGVALGCLVLSGSVSYSLNRRDVTALSAALTQQTLQRVTDRLDELVRTTAEHQRLFPTLSRDGELTSRDFPSLFNQLWSTVQPHAELSYLGVGIAATGEYAMVHHPPGESLSVRMYVRDEETGPEIRDYRPTVDGLELTQRIPWTNSGSPYDSYDLSSRPFYQQAVQARRAVWTDSYQFWGGVESGNQPGVTHVTPIFDAQGELKLVWDIDLELTSLAQFLDRIEQPISGRLLIVEQRLDGTWRLLAHSSKASGLQTSDEQDQLAMVTFVSSLPRSFPDAAKTASQLPPFNVQGEKWESVYGVLQGPDRPRWLVAEIWPLAAAPQPASPVNQWFLATFAMIGSGVGVIAWGLARYIAFPIQQLQEEARLLAAGERTRMPVVGGPDEVRSLSITLNALSDSLQQRQRALETANRELRLSHERLQKHIEGTPVGALEIDPNGLIVDWNRAAEQIFFWTRDEVLGRRFDIIVPPEIKTDIEAVVAQVFHSINGLRHDNQNITKDGRTIDCEWFNTPLFGPNGEPFGIACLVLDVTERKQQEREILRFNESLESLVQERTHKLQLAVEDLESFSYSVAHDLRAPLRSIHGFSSLLQEELKDSLTPELRDYLRRMCDGAQHMAELIDALLRLTRVVRKDVQYESVDLSELARQTFSRLAQAESERQVEIRIEPHLIVRGDRHLLRILMENLCDNAWKYSRSAEQPVLEFLSEERPDGRWYAIRDNGVGFDPAYAHKALEPFQRLHTNAEFEGHGIGLATADRILRKHRGEIRLEPVPTGGAVCWFRIGSPTNDSSREIPVLAS